MKSFRLFLLAALFMVFATVGCSTANAAPAEPTVKISTSLGDIIVQLNRQRAPISTENFLQYARSGFYNGTIFHRVIKGFMIQGGGLTADMREKAGRAPIKNEASNGLPNQRYTIAMARTSVPDSATSQFFINTKNNSFLNARNCADGVGYAVFGKVIKGQEVVDKIEGVSTGHKGYHDDVPTTPVVINSVTILSE